MPDCKRCDIELVAGENWSSGCVNNRTRLCRACNSAKGKEWSKSNRARARDVAMKRRHSRPEAMRTEKASYYERHREKWREYAANVRRKMMGDPARRAQLMLSFTRSRAKKKGIPFDIDLDFVRTKLERGLCEATGLPLAFDQVCDCKTKKHPHSPSLDRRDPNLGYTRENVRVVAYIYNVAKADYADADVLELARAIVAANDRGASSPG